MDRQALKFHPDRVPASSPERPARTKKFQLINDAYFTLSDPTRRRDYDAARTSRNFFGGTDTQGTDSDPEEEEIPRQAPPNSGGGSFPWSAFGFGNNKNRNEADSENFSNQQFGSAFEEMLREEGMAEGQSATPTSKFWSLVGGLSGGAMGVHYGELSGRGSGSGSGESAWGGEGCEREERVCGFSGVAAGG